MSKVFAIEGVKPEVLAYAMAKYSRSRLSLEESIDSITGSKAADFLNTFYFQYGHRSIADLAHVPLAVEDISMLAAIELVDESRWDGQERSTRYQDFSKPRYYVPEGFTEEELALYHKAILGLYAAYDQLTKDSIQILKTENPIPEGMDQAAYDRTIKARAFDISRYLLPMATLTSVGQITSARTLAGQVSRLGASPYAEVRKLALDIQEAAVYRPAFSADQEVKETIISELERGGISAAAVTHTAERLLLNREPIAPTLVKYAEPDQYAIQLRELMHVFMEEALQGLDAWDDGAPTGITDYAYVDLIEFKSLREELVATLIYEYSNYPMRLILQAVRNSDDSMSERVLYMTRALRGPHDELPRAFRCGYGFTFDIHMDIGGMRDLHRHRRCVQIHQEYTAEHATVMPPQIAPQLKLGYVQAVREMMDTGIELITLLEERGAELNVMSYIMPLGFRRRFLMKMDLAELNYITELRTGPAGHPSYRHAAWQMFQLAKQRYADTPDLFEGWRVTDPNQPIDLLKR